MFQAFIERFSDVLVPVACGLCVWLGLHYFVITPRILKAEMPSVYDELAGSLSNLPESVHTCQRDNLAGAVLQSGRFDAAVYTASLKYISAPFQKAVLSGLDALDRKCGTTQAIAAQTDRLRREAERQEQERIERAQSLAQEKLLALERLRQQAEAQAQKRKLEMIGTAINLLFGGKR